MACFIDALRLYFEGVFPYTSAAGRRGPREVREVLDSSRLMKRRLFDPYASVSPPGPPLRPLGLASRGGTRAFFRKIGLDLL
jgi:hypothetical protein